MGANIGSFSYGFVYDDKKYFVEVEVKVNITRKDLKKIIESALQYPDFKNAENKKIAILSKEVYVCNGERHSVEGSSLHKITKLFRLVKEPLAERVRTFSEIKTRLLEKLSPQTAIEHFFCDFGVTIVAAFIRLFNPEKVYNLAQIGYLNDGNGRFSLEMAMKDISILCKGGSKKEQSFGNRLEQGIEWAKIWQEQPNQRIKLIDEIVSEIPEKEMLCIPSGSWGEDGVFSPTMITLQREADKIILQDIGYGEAAENAKKVVFSGADNLKAVLSGLLSLSTFQIETTKEIPKSLYESVVNLIKTHAPILLFFFSTENLQSLFPEIPSVTKPQHSVDTFKNALYQHYAENIQEAAVKRKTIQKDPLKIIHEMIAQTHPELSLADKTLFVLQIVHMQANRIVEALPQMTLEEKQQWVTKIESQFESLSRSLSVEGEVKEVLSQLKATIQKIRHEAELVTERAIASRQKGLNGIQSLELGLTVPFEKLEKVTAQVSLLQSRPTENDLQALDAIEQSFQSLDKSQLPMLAKQIGAFSQRIDALVDEKNYELASSLAHQVLSKLPLPGSLTSNLDSIPSEKLVDTFVVLDIVSVELGKIAEYFWESKFRQIDMKLLPENAVAFTNLETFLLETIETQKCVLERLPPDGRNYYIQAFLDVEQQFKKDPMAQSTISHQDSLLRIHENPELSKKYSKLCAYCNRLPRGKSKTAEEYRKEENELCKLALMAYGGDPSDAVQRIDMETQFFIHQQNYRIPQVPVAFRELSRVRLLYGSMYYPESSIARNGATGGGLIQAFGEIGNIIANAERLTEREYKEQRRKEIFLQVVEKFKDVARIEVGRTSGGYDYSILPKGTKDDFFPFAVIEPTGLAGLQQIVYEATANQTAHFDQLGAPRVINDRTKLDIGPSAEVFNNALNEEDEYPLELFYMNGAKRGYGGEGYVHKVIDSLIHRPWSIDREIKKSSRSTKRGFEVQKRDYDVLFSLDEKSGKGYLELSLTKTPEYFLTHAGSLKKTLDEAIQNKRFEQAFFLGYVINTLTQHLKITDLSSVDPVKQAGFKKLQQEWSKIFPEDGFETLLDFWNSEGCEGQAKIDGAVYLTRMLSNRYSNSESIRQWLNSDSKPISNLFTLAEFTRAAENAATIPLLSVQSQMWFRERVAPEILKLPHERQTELFDTWAANKKFEYKAGEWNKLETTFVWQKNDLQIDLFGPQLFSVAAASSALLQAKLPLFVSQNPDYESIFYGRSLSSAIRPGKALGEMIYSFTDNGVHYEAHVNQSHRSCQLLRRREGETAWSLFVIPKSLKAEGVEKSIVRSGIWINTEKPDIGACILYPGQCYTKASNEVALKLSPDGKVEKIFTKDGLEVVEAKGDLLPLECLPREQMLFLKKEGESFISEIRIVGQAISLKRVSLNDPWKVYGDDRCDGLIWTPGQESGITAGNTFLFWPQKTADKEPHALPPLAVSLKENGKMSGSSVSFLGLAYLKGQTKEYTEAFDLLNQAKNAKIGSASEREHLKQLKQFFQSMPVRSAQSALLRVKALLTIRKIIQQQTLEEQFSKQEWKEFLKLSQSIASAYKDFEVHLEKSPLANKKEFYKEAFSLTEAKEIDSVIRESLSLLLEEAKKETKSLELLSPSKEELQSCMPLLVKRVKKPLSDTELLASLALHPDLILDHFLDLYNLIAKSGHEIKEHQMTPLFAPIRDTNQKEIATIDTARRLLLSAWHAKKSGVAIAPISLNQMKALEIFIPEPQMTISFTGFEAKKNIATVDRLAKENVINLRKLKEIIKNDPSLFGPIATPMVEKILITKELESAITGVPIDCEQLINTIEGKTKINLVEQIRRQEVQKRIEVLEKAKALPAGPKDISVVFTQEELPALRKSIGKPINTDKLVDNLDRLKNSIKNQVTDEGLKSGLDKASASLHEKLLEKKYFESDDLPAFAQDVMRALGEHKSEKARLGEQIRRRAGDIEGLKKAYQLLEISDQSLVKDMTLYLMHEASEKILTQNMTSQLEVLSQFKVDLNNPQSIAEWQNLSSKALALFERSENFSRYIENNLLKDPVLSCKLLVLEASQGIICTKEQIDLIKKIVANPEDWYELKVGLGKTSVVFPIVLLMLLEKGEFPAAIVKDELLQENLDSLDRSTRDLLEQAGVEFTFRLNDPSSLSTFQEQYHRLLEVRANKGYPITTLASLIDLDEKAQLLLKERQTLTDDLKKKMAPIDSDQVLSGTMNPALLDQLEPYLGEILAIHSITQQLAMIGKVRGLFDFLFFDEADDILNVVFERNVSIGAPEALDPTIQDTMKHIMRVIFTSDNEHLQKFKIACREGQQASLEPEFVEENFIPALCSALLHDPIYLKTVGDMSQINIDDLQKQLCTTFKSKKEVPEFPHITKVQKKRFGVLERILQSTLKIVAKQNPGINTGVKNSDGFQVGPKVSGQEQVGTIFGSEYDLIVNHYFFYGIAIPEVVAEGSDRSFATSALGQIHQQYPASYKAWEIAAEKKGQTILQFLNDEANIQERLDFTEKALFLELRLKVFKKQISYNVQHVCYDRRFGGMTGTLSRNSLPKTAAGSIDDNAKEVTALVLLEAALLADPAVTQVGESEQEVLSRMSERLHDHIAIINQGFDLKKGNTQEVIVSLRENHRDKTFIFVDSKTRKDMIWIAGEESPKEVAKAMLNRLAIDPRVKSSLRYIYSPPDIRGVDRRIPPGKATTFLGPGCSMDDFIQDLGRMREAGTIHSMDFEVGTGVMTRIRSSQKLSKERSIVYAHCIEDISGQTQGEDRKKNLKSGIEEMNAIIKNGTRKMLFGFTRRPSRESKEAQLFVHMGMDNTLLTTANWLEEDKTLDLEMDFSATTREEQSEYIKRVAAQQREKIGILDSCINQFTPDRFLHMNLPEVKEAYNTHLEYLQNTLKVMSRNLEHVEKRILKILENPEQKIYPPHSLSNGSDLPQTLVQVQEQVLQQAQQQTQTQQQQLIQTETSKTKGIPERLVGRTLTSRSCGDWANMAQHAIELKLPDRMKVKIWQALQPFGRYLGNELEITHNTLQLLAMAQGFKGNPEMYRIGFQEAQDRLQIISDEDYLLREASDTYIQNVFKIEQAIENMPIPDDNDGVFSIDKEGKPVLNKHNEGFDAGERVLSDLTSLQYVKKLACAKWLMGCGEYSEVEKQELKNFFTYCNQNQIDLEPFMENYATKEQRELMEQLV